MRFDTEPINLRPETETLLDRLRTSREPLPVYGLAPKQAEAAVRAIIDPMLEGAAMSDTRICQHRWCALELARILGTRTGPALVFQLELFVRKWVAFGLEPKTVQFLLHTVVEQLKGIHQQGGQP